MLNKSIDFYIKKTQRKHNLIFYCVYSYEKKALTFNILSNLYTIEHYSEAS